MKWLVWILILLNLMLFSYFRFSEMAASGGQVGREPLQAERLRLLTAEQLAALPRAAPTETAPVDALACYEWGGFTNAYVPRARSVLEQLGVEFSVKPAAESAVARYWVYIPPLGSLQQAQARSDALQALGIRDVFIVQDARWRYAISLGIFRDEAPAARRAQELRSRGVNDVVSGARHESGTRNSFVIKNMLMSRTGEIERLRPDFPEAELRQIACE